MSYNCLICGKKIWFFQEGMRLTQEQEASITGENRPTTMYIDGEFAHLKCFINRFFSQKNTKEKGE